MHKNGIKYVSLTRTGDQFVYRARIQMFWKFRTYFSNLNINVNSGTNFDQVHIFNKYEVKILFLNHITSQIFVLLHSSLKLNVLYYREDKILKHVTAFRGCVGNRTYDRDHITKLFHT